MKKLFIVLLISFVGLFSLSCKGNIEDDNTKNKYIGYISIENNILYLDEVEWITDDDKDRIIELELSPRKDMPNGYYIYNASLDKISFKLNDKTVYNFIDWGNDFVGEDEDKRYSTKKQEEFLKYLNTYTDKAARVPFWVETKDDYVISVTEQFVN